MSEGAKSEGVKSAERGDGAADVQAGVEAERGPSNEAPLQFEKAEFDDAPAVLSCDSCKRTIKSQYWQVGASTVCLKCRDLVVSAMESGKGRKPFLLAARNGIAAAVLGSVVWYAIREATGYEIGLVAIGVGILVGMAVKRGSGGLGGRRYQVLAMALTYASIALTNVPVIVGAISAQAETAALDAGSAPSPAPSDPAADAPAPGDPSAPSSAQAAAAPAPAAAAAPTLLGFVITWGLVLLLALASPFLAGFENILGILIIGIGLYEAWKINRLVPVQVEGPFMVQRAREGAEDRAA